MHFLESSHDMLPQMRISLKYEILQLCIEGPKNSVIETFKKKTYFITLRTNYTVLFSESHTIHLVWLLFVRLSENKMTKHI